MDAYTIAKFLHVIGAICWAGGGATLMMMTALARRKGGIELLAALRIQRDVGDRWFVPASLLTLLSGLTMAALGNLWGQAWVVLSLVGYIIAAATGPLLLKRSIHRALAEEDSGRLDLAERAGHKYLRATNFDYSIMVMVIALMVFKPSWADTTALTLAAAVTLIAAGVFLVPAVRKN